MSIIFQEITLPDFAIITEHVLRKKELENNNTAWYEHGMLVNVSPRDESISLDEDRQAAYDARYIISDGITYDLYNPFDIMKIALPDMSDDYVNNDDEDQAMKINIQMPYVTRELPYHLQMRVKRTFSKELAIPLVFKVVNMLLACKTSYGKDTFDRLIEQLYAVDADDYAVYIKKEIEIRRPACNDPDYGHKQHFLGALERAKIMNYDYIEMPYNVCACGECAKYMGRVYCISGEDKRFPKLPEEIIERKQIHDGCRCSFWPSFYHEGYMLYRWEFQNIDDVTEEPIDALVSSNRPFVDDRCEYAKMRYERSVENKRIRDANALKRKRSIDEIKEWGERTIEYEWIEEFLPQLCPKSLSAYTRAKRTKSPKYIKIKEEALKLGRTLNDNNA